MCAFSRQAMAQVNARLVTLTVLILGTAAAGCDKSPLFAPTNSTVTLTASSRALPMGGSTEVTAFVAEPSGTAVQNGTLVRFTTSLGRVDPVEAQTRNGIATATFMAGDVSGVAQVRATSGSIGAGTTGSGTTSTASTTSNVVDIQIGAAAATVVVVSASPSTVASSGGTVAIIASAIDASGNRLVGVPVSFSTTAGTLSASSAITDASGDARVQLTTTREATVTARVSDKTATATVTVAGVTSVTIAVTPTNPVAGQPITLTITPTIAAGSQAPNVVVDWGDGNRENIGTVAAARGVTHIYTIAGSYSITITATAGGETFTTSTAVVVAVGTPVTMTVTPSSGTIATTFVFNVTPATGTVVQNIRVDFGDGEVVDLGAVATSTTLTHRYATAGSKTVRATQTNIDGTTSTTVVVIAVTS